MKLIEICEKLDKELRKESLTLNKNENTYVVPPRSCYDTYEEMFREYEIFGERIFTVMLRNNKNSSEYWVRCGYKDNPYSAYVGGIVGRDCTTHNVDDIIKHCKKQFNTILIHNGW